METISGSPELLNVTRVAPASCESEISVSVRLDRHSGFRSRFNRCFFQLAMLLFFLCRVLCTGPLGAQDPVLNEQPAVETELQNAATEPSDPPSVSDPDRTAKEDEKLKKIAIMMSAVGGIVILGVGAIASLMIWARHLRRVARATGPIQRTEGNDFWFLKPPKHAVSDSNVGETHRPIHTTPDENKPE